MGRPSRSLGGQRMADQGCPVLCLAERLALAGTLTGGKGTGARPGYSRTSRVSSTKWEG